MAPPQGGNAEGPPTGSRRPPHSSGYGQRLGRAYGSGQEARPGLPGGSKFWVDPQQHDTAGGAQRGSSRGHARNPSPSRAPSPFRSHSHMRPHQGSFNRSRSRSCSPRGERRHEKGSSGYDRCKESGRGSAPEWPDSRGARQDHVRRHDDDAYAERNRGISRRHQRHRDNQEVKYKRPRPDSNSRGPFISKAKECGAPREGERGWGSSKGNGGRYSGHYGWRQDAGCGGWADRGGWGTAARGGGGGCRVSCVDHKDAHQQWDDRNGRHSPDKGAERWREAGYQSSSSRHRSPADRAPPASGIGRRHSPSGRASPPNSSSGRHLQRSPDGGRSQDNEEGPHRAQEGDKAQEGNPALGDHDGAAQQPPLRQAVAEDAQVPPTAPVAFPVAVPDRGRLAAIAADGLQEVLPRELSAFLAAQRQYWQGQQLQEEQDPQQEQEREQQWAAVVEAQAELLSRLGQVRVTVEGVGVPVVGVYTCALNKQRHSFMVVRPGVVQVEPGEPPQPVVTRKAARELLQQVTVTDASSLPHFHGGPSQLQLLSGSAASNHVVLLSGDIKRDLSESLLAVVGYGLVVAYYSGLRFRHSRLNAILADVPPQVWKPQEQLLVLNISLGTVGTG